MVFFVISCLLIPLFAIFRSAIEENLTLSDRLKEKNHDSGRNANNHQRGMSENQEQESHQKILVNRAFNPYDYADALRTGTNNKKENALRFDFASECSWLKSRNTVSDQSNSQLFQAHKNKYQISNLTKNNEQLIEEGKDRVINRSYCFSKSQSNDHGVSHERDEDIINTNNHRVFDANHVDSFIDPCTTNTIKPNMSLMTHGKNIDLQGMNNNQSNKNKPSTKKAKSSVGTLSPEDYHRGYSYNSHKTHLDDSDGSKESAKFKGMGKDTMKSSWLNKSIGNRSFDKRDIKPYSDGMLNLEGERASSTLKRKNVDTNAPYLPSCNGKEYHHNKAENKRNEYYHDGGEKEWKSYFVTEDKNTLSSREYDDGIFSMKKSLARKHAQEKKHDEGEVESGFNSTNFNKEADSVSPIFHTKYDKVLNRFDHRISCLPGTQSHLIDEYSSKKPTQHVLYDGEHHQKFEKNKFDCQYYVSDYDRNTTNLIDDVDIQSLHNQSPKEGNSQLVTNSSTDRNESQAKDQGEMELTLVCINGDSNIYEAGQSISQPPNMAFVPDLTTSSDQRQTQHEVIGFSPHVYNYTPEQRFCSPPTQHHPTTLNQTDIHSPLGSPASIPTAVVYDAYTNPPNVITSHDNMIILPQPSPTIRSNPPAASNPNSTFLLAVPNVSPLSQTSSSIDSGYGGPGSVGSIPSSTYSAADSPVSSYAHTNGNAVNIAGFPNSPWQTQPPDFSVAPSTVGSTSSTPSQNFSSDIHSMIHSNDQQTQFNFNVNSSDHPVHGSFLPLEYASDICANVSNTNLCGEQNNFATAYNNISNEYCPSPTLPRLSFDKPAHTRNSLYVPVQNEYQIGCVNPVNQSRSTSLTYNENTQNNENSSTNSVFMQSQISSPKFQQVYSQSETSPKDDYNLSQKQDNLSERHCHSGKVLLEREGIFDSNANTTNAGHITATTSSENHEQVDRKVDAIHASSEEVQNLHDSDIQTIVDSLYREGFVGMEEQTNGSDTNHEILEEHNRNIDVSRNDFGITLHHSGKEDHTQIQPNRKTLSNYQLKTAIQPSMSNTNSNSNGCSKLLPTNEECETLSEEDKNEAYHLQRSNNNASLAYDTIIPTNPKLETDQTIVNSNCSISNANYEKSLPTSSMLRYTKLFEDCLNE